MDVATFETYQPRVVSRNLPIAALIVLTPLLLWGLLSALVSAPDLGTPGTLARGGIVLYAGLTLAIATVAFLRLFDARVGFFMLMATHVIWFALPALATLTEGRWWGDIARYRLSEEAVIKATLMIGLFLVLNLVGYALVAWRGRVHSAAEALNPPHTFVPNLTLVLGGLFFFGVIPYLVLGGSLGEIIANITAARTAEKPWSQGAHLVADYGPAVILGRASLVTFSAIGLWLVLARQQFRFSRLSTVLLAGAALLGLVITFFDSGTRTWTIIIIGPAALAAFIYRLGDRNLVRGTASAIVVFLVAVVLVQVQRFYRFTASLDSVDSSEVVELADNDFFTETAIAVDLVPRFGYLEQFEPALYVTNFIPRSLWENKPYSQTLRYYSLGRSGFDEYLKTGTSRMPSVVGQPIRQIVAL